MRTLKFLGMIMGGALLLLSACSDSDGGSGGSTAAVCSSNCSKMVDCGILTDQAACESQCNSGSGGGTCKPTSAQLSACQSDFQAASCNDLANGNLPASCTIQCGSGGSSGSGGNGGSSNGGNGGSSSSGTCSDLAGCCGNLPDESSIDGCNQLVEAGVDANCGLTYDALEQAGFCGS